MVKMRSAPAWMAAASTCRSLGSGNLSLGISSSYPLMRLSSSAEFIKSRVRWSRARVRSGRFCSKLRVHSSWIRSVHRAAYSPPTARCMSRSRSGAEYRTDASRSAVTPGTFSSPSRVPVLRRRATSGRPAVWIGCDVGTPGRRGIARGDGFRPFGTESSPCRAA